MIIDKSGPPEPLEPSRLVNDQTRLTAVDNAIQRRLQTYYPIPEEWVKEHNDIVARLG